MTIPLLEQCLFSIILMLMLFCEHVPNLAVLRLLLHNNCQHNWHFRILNFYHFALTFFINFLKENNNLNNINWLIKNLKTLWYFFTDRVQLSNRATTRKQFIFYHSLFMSSYYSFDWKGRVDLRVTLWVWTYGWFWDFQFRSINFVDILDLSQWKVISRK